MLQGMLKLQPNFLGMTGKACPRRVGSQQKGVARARWHAWGGPASECKTFGSRFWLQACQLARAHPDLNQGPADLQSAALTTELCTQLYAIAI